jgi:ABC-type hemin transport system ATPase subunit
MLLKRCCVDGNAEEVLRADLLHSVYGQEMTVVEHPTRNCPCRRHLSAV